MADDEHQELELVFQSIDPVQVRIARDLLDSAGVPTFIFDGESSRRLGSRVGSEPRLMVRGSLAPDARVTLKELGFDASGG